MARIRSPQRSTSIDARRALVDQLVAALRGQEQAEGPVIFEIAQGESGFFQVVIVWKRWDDLPTGVRDQIVQAAYREASGDSPDEANRANISLTLPVTPDQAVALRLLPYSVQSNVHRSHPEYARLRPLLIAEGAIETRAGLELRLPTLEMAREARDHLKEETKNSWRSTDGARPGRGDGGWF